MSINHVLAVVPVSDVDTARAWYAKLLDREPDNNPMPVLVEWQVTESGWVQVFEDASRAGTGLLNFAVDDLDTYLAGLAERGLRSGEVQAVNKGVRLSTINDPDGNQVTLIGSFRVKY